MSDNMNDKNENLDETVVDETAETCLLYTSPSPRD